MTVAEIRKDVLEAAPWTLRLQLAANGKIFRRETASSIAARLGIIVTQLSVNEYAAEHPSLEKGGLNESRFTGTLEDAVIRTAYLYTYASISLEAV
jgi:hypothetical protein